MTSVHPTSILSKECEIGEGVVIGPWCVLAGRIRIGDGVRLIGNVYLQGPLTIGARTVIYPFCAIGFPPQHVRFKNGDPTAGVILGEDTTLREHVTVHAATGEQRATTVGNRNLLMVNSHLGHDARTGNDVVLVNNSALGGHAEVSDAATLGGGALVHQFTRVGRMAFVGGGTRAVADVPPFTSAVERSRLAGINLIGLRRAGVARHDITSVREAFRKSFREPMTRPEMVETLTRLGTRCAMVAEMATFVSQCANRPISVGYERGEHEIGAVV
ncbi:MAG: acyl-ACP--UDP-N-acetylglucosamine O-acyltransferase [Phycisphaeraceae bacterium]|nr:acyl-ACP--UDP-N-acetylglucosamine O-acyltransferase [Phycisphaeraceae bacterium]